MQNILFNVYSRSTRIRRFSIVTHKYTIAMLLEDAIMMIHGFKLVL